MKKLMLIALSTLAMGAQAADEKKFYAGGGITSVTLESSAPQRFKLNLAALEGSFGYEILPWLAAEGRIGIGIERDSTTLRNLSETEVLDADDEYLYHDFTLNETGIKGELSYYGSVYLKPQIKNDVAVLYGLIGYTTYDSSFEFQSKETTGRLTQETTGTGDDAVLTRTIIGTPTVVEGDVVEYDESESTFSMGVGVGFYFKERYVFNLEYKNIFQSKPFGDTNGELKSHGVTASVNYSF